MNQNYFPHALYSQILPGLWQGGTRDHDVIGSRNPQPVTKSEFDTVVTCYGSASPADWGVREYRLGFSSTPRLEVGQEGFNPLPGWP